MLRLIISNYRFLICLSLGIIIILIIMALNKNWKILSKRKTNLAILIGIITTSMAVVGYTIQRAKILYPNLASLGKAQIWLNVGSMLTSVLLTFGIIFLYFNIVSIEEKQTEIEENAHRTYMVIDKAKFYLKDSTLGITLRNIGNGFSDDIKVKISINTNDKRFVIKDRKFIAKRKEYKHANYLQNTKNPKQEGSQTFNLKPLKFEFKRNSENFKETQIEEILKELKKEGINELGISLTLKYSDILGNQIKGKTITGEGDLTTEKYENVESHFDNFLKKEYKDFEEGGIAIVSV